MAASSQTQSQRTRPHAICSLAGEGGIMDNTYGEALIENQVVHHSMISLIFINREVFRLSLFTLLSA